MTADETRDAQSGVEAVLAGALGDQIADDPMWISEDGEPLDYLPKREALIADFVRRTAAAQAAALAPVIAAERAKAVEVERDTWVTRLSELCDNDWLRNRDRAMDLPDTKTHGWMRRGSSVWEQAAHQIRSLLNDLADYDDEYVNRHAAYLKWLRANRDRDQRRADREQP